MTPLPAWLRALFDLGGDQADPATIDATIRSGVEFRGTNLWLLVFATIIASVGLNVNSAAVIIGAMLVSPLMGPIMAVGYGAAVNDFALLRSALRNLAVAVLFSVLASTLYFASTPLHGARSELLARTTPAIWDVLIALFGGLAGIVGVTRREKSNVVPGVAIATALMPPLCTVGYGIATLQPAFALGALYLFSINSVFIATATVSMARVMRFPEIGQVDEAARKNARRAIGAIVFLTGVPSVWLAVGLVRQEVFVSRAEQFVAASFPREGGTYVVGRELDAKARTIRVTAVGETVDETHLLRLRESLAAFGLGGAALEIAQARPDEVDVASLREQVAGDLHRDTLVALDQKAREIEALRGELEVLTSARSELQDVVDELRAAVPTATRVLVGTGNGWEAGALQDVVVVLLDVPEALAPEQRSTLEAWLKVRTKTDLVRLAITHPEPPAPTPRRR